MIIAGIVASQGGVEKPAAGSFTYLGTSGAANTTIIYLNKGKFDYNPSCPISNVITSWIQSQAPSNYKDGDVVKVRSRVKCGSGPCPVDENGWSYQWCPTEYYYVARAHDWVYLTYSTSEPSTSTDIMDTVPGGLTLAEQKQYLVSTYPPYATPLGTTATLRDNVDWTLWEVQYWTP